jgi:hypothetical protein
MIRIVHFNFENKKKIIYSTIYTMHNIISQLEKIYQHFNIHF